MPLIDQLRDLAGNLWWTWQPSLITLFRDIDPALWRRVRHNPVAFLNALPASGVNGVVPDLALEARIGDAFHRLRAYLEEPNTWGRVLAAPLRVRPIAYFSAEFGLHESIPIYSGGLGILAGDHLATASDLDLPMVGVGLFYAQGYFNQQLDAGGRQQEKYHQTDIEQLPLSRVHDARGQPAVVRVDLRDRQVAACLWRGQVGRSQLLLLDCDVEENNRVDRDLTSRLYEGDPAIRIRQELVLGVGGVRALRQLGLRPSVIHLNEGHSAFAILELMRQEMEEDGVDLAEARRRVQARTIFTTHTPIPAGHDRFDPGLTEAVLGPLRESLRLSPKEFLALGRLSPNDDQETFCMTVLALRMSCSANAVSVLHRRVSRQMWQGLWPDRPETEVPIAQITNGVHVNSWLAPPMFELFTRHLDAGWERKLCSPQVWARVDAIDDVQWWEVHQMIKSRMLAYLCRSTLEQEQSRQAGSALHDLMAKRLDPSVLTIAVARRFASYKRVDLLLRDGERLARLVNHAERPVQIVFAGKAHPQDESGKQAIQRIFALMRTGPFNGRLVFIEDYNINVARHLVQGADLWLNLPRRPAEACGTSGMKALFNGVVNCSILDGWWAEAYDGTNGFAIGEGGAHPNEEEQDARDSEAAFRVLEQEVIPAYYERDDRGVPLRWISLAKSAVRTLAWRFNSVRMLLEYVQQCYFPAAGVQVPLAAEENGLAPLSPTTGGGT